MCSVSSRGCCFFYNFLLGVGIGLVLAASGVNRHPSPSSLCCLLTAHFRVSGHSVLFWFGGLGLTIDRDRFLGIGGASYSQPYQCMPISASTIIVIVAVKKYVFMCRFLVGIELCSTRLSTAFLGSAERALLKGVPWLTGIVGSL